jgi:hypothetical protein
MNGKENFPSFEKSERQRRWDEAAERIEKTVDTLGHHIDEGIKDGVIALNVLDVNTHGSCEGHLEHGTAAPYIDIRTKISKEELERWEEVKNEIERRNLEEQRRILPHLDDFYKGRDVPAQRRLVLGNVALGRLESQGARLHKIEDESTRREMLKEYQEEMNEFISFLKEKYFAEEK